MTIHHATVKKAEKRGVILTEIERATGTAPSVAQAHWAEHNKRYVHRDPKEALAAALLQQVFHADYPALLLEQPKFDTFEVVSNQDGRNIMVYATDDGLVPDLADVLDACIEFGIDPEEGYDDAVHVVVPERYKTEYAERGNRNHCGDWLAQQLDGMFEIAASDDVNRVGKFDAASFATFLEKNGVDMTGKWADLPTSGQKGWEGRYRMNGRQKLEKIVASTGYYTRLDGAKVEAPTAYLEELIVKHPSVDVQWSS